MYKDSKIEVRCVVEMTDLRWVFNYIRDQLCLLLFVMVIDRLTNGVRQENPWI